MNKELAKKIFDLSTQLAAVARSRGVAEGEGYTKDTVSDQKRFYNVQMGLQGDLLGVLGLSNEDF